MKRLFILTAIAFCWIEVWSQEIDYYSIHKEQLQQYHILGKLSTATFDSINGFMGEMQNPKNKQILAKRVFGYFPYWAGSNYLNYQWNLLSDLCYFSYEVDPSTGNPLTVYDWFTSAAIDSALANGVRVHLCVTLFSGHATFFNSPTAQQSLITNVISLIQQRGAQGVNIDFEAVPSAYGNALTDFMIDLSAQMHAAIPGSEVSIASPAVNWSGTFNLPVLKQYIDYFMVMGYDYYWNGSSQAGPVSPLYTMTGNYDYNFSKTISYYQSQGVGSEKIIMGVPYYARQWATQGQYAPSNTTGSGTAYTYRFIKYNSSGNYSAENRHLEPNSLSGYYSFNSDGWFQCFLDEVYSLGKKYDIVNRRNLSGIGIWALGYDDGYTELWDLIANKFTEDAIFPETDTIYDSGGPEFNYYHDEIYLYTITAPEQKTIQLNFEYLDLESGYDSLWIFDGPDTFSPLIGGYSGNANPGNLSSTSNFLSFRFSSDPAIAGQGWKAIYQFDPPSAMTENFESDEILSVFPNPTSGMLWVKPNDGVEEILNIFLFDVTGKILVQNQYNYSFSDKNGFYLNVGQLSNGFYYLKVYVQGQCFVKKIIVKKI